MVLLDQDAFLNQLTKILEKTRSTGTIYVTFKRCACCVMSTPSPRARQRPFFQSA